jgi:hypothetical protein
LAVSDQETTRLFQFKKGVNMTAYLPGGYYFIKFDRPHLVGEYTDALRRKDVKLLTTVVSTTLPVDGKETHCHVDLDINGYIVSLVYMGRFIPFADNYMALDGVHEKYLSSLVWRWQKQMIPDLSGYLNSSWVIPIYWDGFLDLVGGWRRQLLELALSSQDEDGEEKEDGAMALNRVDPTLKREIWTVLDKLSQSTTAKATEIDKRVAYETFDNMSSRKTLDAQVDKFLKMIISGYDSTVPVGGLDNTNKSSHPQK